MILSTPSFLFPGTWLENIERAACEDWIEGIELLFFRYDADARDILRRERSGIADLAKRFSYSLHLPDPLGPGDEELVALTRPFVGTYVLHAPALAVDLDDWAALVDTWKSRYGDVFTLEYTGRRVFAAAEELLPGLPLCADTGRLLLDGEDPAGWVVAKAPRISEIHLHGTAGGKDHAPLSGGEAWLEQLIPFLAEYRGRVELEIFSLENTATSAHMLRAMLGAWLRSMREDATGDLHCPKVVP